MAGDNNYRDIPAEIPIMRPVSVQVMPLQLISDGGVDEMVMLMVEGEIYKGDTIVDTGVLGIELAGPVANAVWPLLRAVAAWDGRGKHPGGRLVLFPGTSGVLDMREGRDGSDGEGSGDGTGERSRAHPAGGGTGEPAGDDRIHPAGGSGGVLPGTEPIGGDRPGLASGDVGGRPGEEVDPQPPVIELRLEGDGPAKWQTWQDVPLFMYGSVPSTACMHPAQLVKRQLDDDGRVTRVFCVICLEEF